MDANGMDRSGKFVGWEGPKLTLADLDQLGLAIPEEDEQPPRNALVTGIDYDAKTVSIVLDNEADSGKTA